MARCASSWDANSTILTRSKVRARCWASERYAYPQPLEMPVGVTSTSANRTSPANNPDNQLSHPASHYGPIETGKRKPPAPKLIAIPIRPSPHDRNRLGRSDSHWTGATELVPCPAPPPDLLPPGGHHHSERGSDAKPPLLLLRHNYHIQKSKKRPATETPQPTSPHKLDQVAIFDVVAEVADIYAVLPLAMFGKLGRFFMRRIYWSTERAWDCFRLLAIAVA